METKPELASRKSEQLKAIMERVGVVKDDPLYQKDVEAWLDILGDGSEKAAQVLAYKERDPMTLLYKKDSFLVRAEHLKTELKDSEKKIYLVYGDTEGLKEVNAQAGRAEGDVFINEVATAFKEAGEEGVVGRVGTDEFAIVVAAKDEAESFTIVRKVSERIAELHDSGNISKLAKVELVSIEIGQEDDVDDVIKRADDSASIRRKQNEELRIEQTVRRSGSTGKLVEHRSQEINSALHVTRLIAEGKLNAETGARVLVANMEQTKLWAKEMGNETMIDSLTGAYNRKTFESELKTQLKSGKKFGLLMLDIDHFKNINDSYGHPAGDEALRDFVAVIKSQLREEDIVGRLGGEEFGLIIPSLESEEELKQLAERVRKFVDITPSVYEETVIDFTTSVGGVLVDSSQANDFDKVVKHVDKQLYKSKKGGRNRSTIDPLTI